MPIRTFSLNSQDFYEAVTEPMERPWIPNGALPREPRCRDLEVLRDEEVWGGSRPPGSPSALNFASTHVITSV